MWTVGRRGFIRLLAGAVAGMFAGKAGAVETAQSETAFTGKITNWALYNRLLSDADVLQLYLNPDNPLTEGLVAWGLGPLRPYWPMKDRGEELVLLYERDVSIPPSVVPRQQTIFGYPMVWSDGSPVLTDW